MTVDVVTAILVRGARVLLARRPDGAHLAGCWEFPGGKIGEGETPLEALSREIDEEIGVAVLEAKRIHATAFEYPERKVRIGFYLVGRFDGEPNGLEGQELAWVNVRELRERRLPPANTEVVRLLESLFAAGEA